MNIQLKFTFTIKNKNSDFFQQSIFFSVDETLGGAMCFKLCINECNITSDPNLYT